MNNNLVNLFKDIAQAIRLKTGVSDKINAQDFPQKIREIGNNGNTGASLNIAYGNTEPTDTSKLWIKANEPRSIKFSKDIDGVNSLSAIGALNDYDMSCARVGTKIYLFGGNSSGTQIRMFDTETETLTTLSATFSTYVKNAGCASVGTKIYIFGGARNGTVSNVISVFDTETGLLSTLSTALPDSLEDISCVSIDTHIYLIGGSRGRYATTSIYIFDTITETVRTASSTLAESTCKAGCSRYGDYIYIFGNYSPRDGHAYDGIYKFNIVSESCTKLTTVLPVASYGINCDIIGSKIYLIGGSNTTAVNVFDVLTETITTLDTTLPVSTYNSCCCGLGNDIYVFGGSNLKTINKFSVTHPLSSGDVEVITAPQNFFKLINTSAADVEIGVDRVLIGNADNEAERCEAYLHRIDTKITETKYFTDSCLETTNNTTLTSSVDCSVGDLVVAAIVTRDTLTISDGWTLISTSEINSADTAGNGQRLSFAYKYAENTSETITVTQASSQRLYINMVALPGATGFVDNGYSYVNSEVTSITVEKPNGLILWACSAPLWGQSSPYPQWESSNDTFRIDLGNQTQSRLAIFLDQTNDTEVTFTQGVGTTIIVGSLTIQGMAKFGEVTKTQYGVWAQI